MEKEENWGKGLIYSILEVIILSTFLLVYIHVLHILENKNIHFQDSLELGLWMLFRFKTNALMWGLDIDISRGFSSPDPAVCRETKAYSLNRGPRVQLLILQWDHDYSEAFGTKFKEILKVTVIKINLMQYFGKWTISALHSISYLLLSWGLACSLFSSSLRCKVKLLSWVLLFLM